MKASMSTRDVATDTEDPAFNGQSRDGGCIGWLVVLGSHVCNLFVFGVSQAIGPLFVVVQRHFEESSARTSWILAFLTSVEFLLGPLSNVCVKKIGYRMTVMLGTIISSTGYFLSAFANRIEILYISLGLAVGFGYAIITPACIGIIAFFIRKRFALANVLAACGAGLAVFIFPPLLQALIDNYGWRGSVIVFSALNAQMAVSAALFRAPEEDPENNENNRSEQMSSEAKGLKLFLSRTADTCDFGLFKIYPTFVLFTVASTISIGIGYYGLPAHLVARAENKNMGSGADISLIVSVMGLAGIIGRLVIPVILHFTKKYMSTVKVYGLTLCFAGVCNLASPLAKTYVSYMVYASILGIPVGTFFGLIPQVIRDIVGSDFLTAGAGIGTFFIAIGSLIGPPCGGYIYDVTTDYNNSFYFYGSLLTVGGCMIMILEPYTTRRRRIAESTTRLTLSNLDLDKVCVAEVATQTDMNS
ncbi:monocarboxylate transporter 13-like [Ptychodera flava]|uniref:monocarboxylate transporter 13-like n=1 Tax=Ptychodera flava TaxID=63121 RepID=UPI00396A2CF3